MKRILLATMFMTAVIVGGSGKNVSAINLTECCDQCCTGGFANVGDPHILLRNNLPDMFYMKVLLANPDGTTWRGGLDPVDNPFVISFYKGKQLIFQEQLPIGFIQEATTDPARPVFRFLDKLAAKSGGFETFHMMWNNDDQGWQIEARVFDFNATDNSTTSFAQLKGPNGIEDVELTLIAEIDDKPFCVTGVFAKKGGNKLDLRLPPPVR